MISDQRWHKLSERLAIAFENLVPAGFQIKPAGTPFLFNELAALKRNYDENKEQLKGRPGRIYELTLVSMAL
ncbi:MAG: hypothetical protein AAGD96_17000 [Chloroflexota bacterium]